MRVSDVDSGTKTDAVRNRVFRAILSGDFGPGDRIPTERGMAELTGTSRITVRRAYAELESRGILERRQGSGTTISTRVAAASRGIREVALLTDVMDPFGLAFLTAMEEAVTARGALMVFRITRDDPAREAEAVIDLVSQGVNNLVIWPGGTVYDAATYRRLRILGANMVFFDRFLPGEVADFVGLDNAHAMHLLLEETEKRAFRERVFLTFDTLMADSNRERIESFEQWCRAKRLPYRTVTVPWKGSRAPALAAFASTLGKRDETAVFCVNDTLALQVREVAGRNAAVFGIDGAEAAREAGILTVSQPLAHMAARAVGMLYEQQDTGASWTARIERVRGTLCPVTR